jgi:DNA repair protein RadC
MGALLFLKGESMMEKSKFWNDLKSGKFVSMVKESAKGRQLSNSQQAYNVLKPLFAKEDDVEKVYSIFLNAQNQILAIEKSFTGSISGASIYPREILKRIIFLKASAFLISHNHPSGNPTPSAEDQSITVKLGIAAASIDVAFHDHIIIGNGYHSMADSGWLKSVSQKFSNLLKPESIQNTNDRSSHN